MVSRRLLLADELTPPQRTEGQQVARARHRVEQRDVGGQQR